MSIRLTPSVLALSLIVGVAPASAQRRTRAQRAPARASMPAAGSWAVGGSLGVVRPAESLSIGLKKSF
jgi:hypothetical protein